MKKVLISTWPLFFGLAFGSASYGLQGSLLPIRAFDEHFDTSDMGVVMSGYFVGYLLGALIAPRMVQRVGHAKVFGAFASIASATALLHATFVNIPSWFALRVATGLCFAAILIVTETWLNDRSSNETRGKIMNLYIMITGAAMGVGSLLVNVSSPRGYDTFVLASVLISIGLVPILLSAKPSPDYQVARRIGFRKIYRKAPLGVGAITLSSVSSGALVGAGPIYADKADLTYTEVGTFMAIVYFASLVFMVPLGHMADRFDRGRFIATMSLLCVLLTILLALTPPEYELLLYCLITPFSGICLAHYGFSLAATNDFLEPEEMVGAGATIFTCSSAGMVIGPILSTEVIEAWGAPSYFIFLAVVHMMIIFYVLGLAARQRGVPVTPRRQHLPVLSSLQNHLATSIMLEEQILQRQYPK